jgi:hypothetical protein
MHIEGQPGSEPDDESPEAPTGPSRYVFAPPDAPSGIEFKRVRRIARDPAPAGPGKKRISRRRILVPAAGLAVVLVIGLGLFGEHGRQAKNHLEIAAGLFVQLQQQVLDADVAAARGTLAALQSETKAARDATDGFGWRAAGHLPLVGDDLRAVATVSAVLDDLAGNGLPALLAVAAGLDPANLAPQRGRIDVASLSRAAPQIAGGLAVIRRAQRSVAGIRVDGLIGRLGTAVTLLSDGLAKAERLTETADRAARLLPTMLGSNGPRTYLVLFQNNAEIRATGGMPGAYIVISADAGAIEVVDQGTATSDLGIFDRPVLTLGEDMEALYTERPAVFPADVNLSPDFPTAALLAQVMYQKRKGVRVDGVMATDPVALSYLLRVTGAVKLPGGDSLTSENAVRMLLSEAYVKYPDALGQDAFFAGAAHAVFLALLNGQGDPKGIPTELARAAGERRLLVWSADKAEEAILSGTVLAGRMPDDDAGNPTVGVFLNDGSGAKLDYYLTHAAALSVGGCMEDGSRELRLRLTVGSTAPDRGLPAAVTGLALSGDSHTSRTNIMVFSPTGGAVVAVSLDGRELDFGSGLERDRGVGVITVDLPPGGKKTYDIAIETGAHPAPGREVKPRLWTTPGVRPWRTTVTSGTKCA